MRRVSYVGLVAIASSLACGGAPANPGSKTGSANLDKPFLEALRTEATGDPTKARERYVDAIKAALAAPDDGWSVPTVNASLDALVFRDVAGLDDTAGRTALVFRTAGDALPMLEDARKKASDPFTPGLIARALEALAEHRGDVDGAEKWRRATGCAREVTVIGPLAWAPVTGVGEADPLEKADAKLDATYPAPGAFGVANAPVVVSGRGCSISLSLGSIVSGVRDVVVDVPLDKAQTVGIALRTRGEAMLRVGGMSVLRRAYELGGDDVVRFARIDATAGVLRIVARVGMGDDGEPVEIDVFDAKGNALPTRAPKPGDAGTARATAVHELMYPTPHTDAERVLLGAAALAAGDGPTAERLLHTDAQRKDAPPELSLVYARAVETVSDLQPVHRAERARTAYERVIDAWPTSWEAILAHAGLAAVRRGQSEARIEALTDLDSHRAKAGKVAAPMLDLFDAAASGRDELHDRADAALARVKASLPGVPLVTDVERIVTRRTGAERIAYECGGGPGPAPLRDKSDFACFDALRSSTDYKRAMTELARVRTVRGTPNAYLALELRDALGAGDATTAKRAFDAMLPAERTLSFFQATSLLRQDGASTPATLRDLFTKTALTARDAPSAYGALLRAAGDDPVAAMTTVAERIAADDRKKPILPNAATAVLAHTERYDVEPSGIVHAVMLDVRRVSGTKDVEDNAQANPPEVTGQSVFRVLRRRILKRDGRIVEPDRTPHASQGHADLSQLEAGDVVEAIYETWSLPGETGDITIDTPDLLPERTAVHDATIEFHLPRGIRSAMWSHPILGKAEETAEGTSRVLRYRLTDHVGRRLELGTPKMDQSVSVSFSTATWADVGRALRETTAGLNDHHPEVAEWAHAAAKGKPPESPELVGAIVEASGTAVKESSPALLADVGLGRARGEQTTTARTILANHEGSRTWLVARALREVGVNAEVVVAEDDPFSADPAFPPHFGRFMHPLAIAHLPGGKDIWIDPDVAGPPLPAGRISPELRGRSVLHYDGTIAPMPAVPGDSERDEVDLRLTLDEKGDAKGLFTVILRGRESQELAEALFRIVGAERQRALRGVVLAWIPYANVDEVALSSSEGSWQIAIRASISVSGYAQAEGAGAASAKTFWLPGNDPLHIVFPRAFVSTLGATYAHQGARETALAVSSSAQYHFHRKVTLPAGASIVRSPSAFSVKGAELGASRTIAVSAEAVEDDYVLDLPTGTVSPKEYGEFVRNAHRVDDAFLASTRIKLAK